MSKPKFNTIRQRLTFWLLMLALLPLLLSLVSIYMQRVGEIRTDTYDKLITIRNLKVQQLNSWIAERLNEVHIISEGNELRELENIFAADRLTLGEQKKLKAAEKLIFRYLFYFSDFDEISFIDAKTGIIEISTNSLNVGQNQANNVYFTGPLKSGDVFIKDIYYSRQLKKKIMTISTPVRCSSHNSHIIGVLVVRVNLSTSLYPLLNNKEGLGLTGETLIVNKAAIALNELRWYDNAPLNLKIKAAPAQHAVKGETGIIEDMDYRGELVLAAYTHIPQTAWGFVCKQDMYELRAPVRKMLRNFIFIFLLITILSIILAWYIGKSVAKPIVAIHNVAQKIKSGDFSVRNVISSNDELGMLAQEFNNMADFTESKIIIQQGVSQLSEIIIRQSSMFSFAKQIISILMDITEANMAVFYVLDEEHGVYEHFTSIGANSDMLKPFKADFPEGEFGNALAQKHICYIQNVPENTLFNFNTTAGQFLPKEIITIPVMAENTVVAFISLANIKVFNKTSIDIIHQSWLSINTAYSSLLSNERTAVLAENLVRMNSQLEAQSEELRSSTEELYDQNIELEKQKIKVEEANRLKSEFLSNMSHELRTPLNSINALSQVLISQVKNKLTDDESNYLKIIERNGKNLLSLINDILDLSRIEAGKMDIVPKSLSINSLLSVIKDMLTQMADNKGVSIQVDIAKNLPWVESDEMRLHQVLLNVISNAVKFTEKGTVSVDAFHQDSNIIIKVSDTGIGIAEDVLPHIFDEFRQADGSSSRKYEGTGLGLAIAKKLIKILGGDILVESKLGVGSVFTVLLPIKWPHKVSVKHKPDQDLITQQNNKPVLIVEDDIKIADEIATYLNQAGFDTVVAQTGIEALYLVEKHSFFAITLDIYMPETDGWEVLQKLKANPNTRDIPVIIVSIADDRTTGFAMGAIGYIGKPVKKELLMAEIYKLNQIPKTILIADDNESDLKEMASVIVGHEFEIMLAKNGEECMHLINKKAPDLLILDLLMPKMDGFEVLQVLRKNPDTRNLPVIIVTAKDLTATDKNLLQTKVSPIIAKTNTYLNNLYKEIASTLNLMQIPEKLDLNKANTKTENKPTLLIVEDNLDNMTTFRAILSQNYNLIEAIDGEEGVRLAQTQLPDLVLLDMSLPKMDGEHVLRVLSENATTKHIPVIAVSARVMKGDKEKFLNAGCDDFVPKPINGDELLKKISKLLGKQK